jgi:hypothetical protein
LGTRTYMRGTYDRTGGNDHADASHFLYQTNAYSVPFELAGPGVLVFARANYWHGSPWHYLVDGQDFIVSETNTADPDHPLPHSLFLPADLFPSPLAETGDVTQGADLNWVPISFAESFTLGYERTHLGTGYYIAQIFARGATNGTQPITAWSRLPPEPQATELLSSAGSDQSPSGCEVATRDRAIDLPASGEIPLLDLPGPATLRLLRLSAPLDSAVALGHSRLRVTWDDRQTPSIDAPVALLFGAGTLYRRDDRTDLVKALPATIRFTDDRVELALYFPMPFLHHAALSLVSGGNAIADVRVEVRTVPYSDPANWVGYFHATYVDHLSPQPGLDLVLLDTQITEGGGNWCGHFVGTSLIFSDRAVLTTLEGDPRFFFDDSQTPQAYGTGTEEWGGGGNYWGGNTVTLPLAGHPTGAPDLARALSPEDAIESAYRFLLADLMPFGRNARIQLEHGGLDESDQHYQTVAFWYGLPRGCLEPTDSLHVGDVADEGRHQYVSPSASSPEPLTARFDALGVDHVGSMEVLPPLTDTGRHMTTTSEFTMTIRPDNVGVLLRRRLDYAYPDQRAEVEVADVAPGAPFASAGTWYLAGSTTSVFSDPDAETGATEHTVQVSDRRFREDEFLIAREQTQGKSALRIRITFSPVSRPPYPGAPVSAQAWSEFRYWAYSYVMP